MLLGLQTPTHITEREVCIRVFGHCQRLDTIALMLVCCSVDGILQTHVGVEGIVAWTYLIFRDRIIERCRYLSLLWEEFAQFE